MKRQIAILSVVIFVATFSVATVFSQEKPLKWMASTQGTTVFKLTTSFASYVRQHTDIKVFSSATGGTVENMRLLLQKDADLAASASSDIVQAWNGYPPYTSKNHNIRQLFTHYDLAWFILTFKKNNITKLSDLSGKTLGAASVGSSAAVFTKMYMDRLKEKGIIDDVRLEYMSFTRQGDMLVQGRLDAVMAYTLAGTEAGWLKSIVQRVPWKDIKMIPIREEDFEYLQSKGYPAPLKIKIGEKDTGLITAGLTGVQIVRSDMDEELAYRITKTIYDNIASNGDLKNAHAILKKYEIDDFMNFFVKSVPIHKGAARYFKEVGIWKENLITK